MQLNTIAADAGMPVGVNRYAPSWKQLASRLGSMLACVLMIMTIAGCSGLGKEIDPTVGWTAERLYKEAKEEISVGNWTQASKLLEKLESRYPHLQAVKTHRVRTLPDDLISRPGPRVVEAFEAVATALR